MSDPLIEAWNEASHADDWNVPVVYEKTFLTLVAAELDRLVKAVRHQCDIDNEDDDEDYRCGYTDALDQVRDRAAELRALS
jgi:hypothetical protein